MMKWPGRHSLWCTMNSQRGAMTELTISADEIRSAIEGYVADYAPEVSSRRGRPVVDDR